MIIKICGVSTRQGNRSSSADSVFPEQNVESVLDRVTAHRVPIPFFPNI